MKQKKQSKSYSAPALEKGLDILELLSNFEEGLSQAEIAGRLNKSVNEIYRMITTLKNREYVDFDNEKEVYRLSFKILNMTAKFEPVKTLTTRAITIMKEIATKANQSIHLAIYTKGKILIIAQEDSPSSFNYHVSVGASFDLLETSSGRVILTFQNEKERKRRLERRNYYSKLETTSKISISELKKIEKLFSKNTMKNIEKNKYELVKSLQIKGVTNISVPIFDYTNYAIAALTIPFVDRIITKGELNLSEVKKLLIKSGQLLSSEMGYKDLK